MIFLKNKTQNIRLFSAVTDVTLKFKIIATYWTILKRAFNSLRFVFSSYNTSPCCFIISFQSNLFIDHVFLGLLLK